MNESILNSIKKLLGGISADYPHFDEDVITYINLAFARLHTLGVGPDNGFSITDQSSVWADFMDEGPTLNICKVYVQLKVQVLFDSPTISAVLTAMEDQIKELEWLLNSIEDYKGD